MITEYSIRWINIGFSTKQLGSIKDLRILKHWIYLLIRPFLDFSHLFRSSLKKVSLWLPIYEAKYWPYTHFKGLINSVQDSFICCKDHFPPTTTEVLFLKQQCSQCWTIMVAYHIPWRGTSNFKWRCWQCVFSQGRQLPLDNLSKLEYFFITSSSY